MTKLSFSEFNILQICEGGLFIIKQLQKKKIQASTKIV